MLQDIAMQRGIAFRGYSENWLIELEQNTKVARILGYKFDLNSSVAGEIAQDKVAAYQVLDANAVEAIPHYLIRTKAGEAQWRTLDWAEGMVIKPLMGTSGHGVKLLFDANQAEAAMVDSGIEAWAASPYYEVIREIRVIILDGVVLLAYKKQPVEHDGLKMFNLGRGARAVEHTLTDEQRDLAQKAQKALGLRLCAVDIIQTNDGILRVLEVNDGIMMENYARQSQQNKLRTQKVYAAIVEKLFSERQNGL